MAEWAMLTSDGIVENIIVVEDGDEEFAHKWATDKANDYHQAIQVDSLDPVPGIGWIHHSGQFIRPIEASALPDTIPADGATTSVVSYQDNRPEPDESVDGDINGQPFTLALTSGVGSIGVTSSTPGDTIAVTIGSTSTIIQTEG